MAGTGTLMFQANLPYDVSTYPHSRKVINELFDGVGSAVSDGLFRTPRTSLCPGGMR